MASNIAANIQQIRQIPAPGGEFGELLRAVSDDQANLTDLVDLLDLCPLISARLLQCANSAYFGQGGRIYSVREAVIRVLGLSLTRSLTLAFVLADSFDAKKVPNFDSQRHWYTAIVTASLAQEMAPSLRSKIDAPAIYTTGLIHNIGIQALIHTFPEQMNELLVPTRKQSLAELTRKMIGIDHYQAGALLVRSWNLPKEIVEPIYYLRNAHYDGSSCQLSRLIRLCSKLATILYESDTYTLRNYQAPEELISQPFMDKAVFSVEEQLSTLRQVSQILTRPT